MDTTKRSSIAGGLMLILLGMFFFIFQLSPNLGGWFNVETSWPLILIGIGLMFLLIAILVNVPGMAVPAAVLSGIGGLLYWQNGTDGWESWGYAWTLIPGFVGVGLILRGILGERRRYSIERGLWLVLISGIMFAVVGSSFGALGVLSSYWPLILIGLGLLLIIRPALRFAARE